MFDFVDYSGPDGVERGVSGSVSLDERPEGKVITPKLDRMFRSALNALGVPEGLKQQGSSACT
jgi:putative DNA-invertase from lambdoid prophage Rac